MEILLSQISTWPLVGIALVLGLVVGSFLNVVIVRLPKMMSNSWKADCCDLLELEPPQQSTYNLLLPASECPECGHKIRAWQNIPVLSYLFLRGRCSGCRTRISIRYPLVEVAAGILSVLVLLHFGATAQGLWGLFFVWALLTLTVIDIDTQLLPDSITIPLLWLGLLVNSAGTFVSLEDAVYGAVAGYLLLWSVYWGFKLLTGKEGMGYGDFKLLAALGAWMGWQSLPLIVLLSSLVGAVIGIAGIIIQGRDKNIPIPFGPYLAIAGFIALLWGETLLQMYLQFVNIS